jgi:hypothetical protein
MEHPFFDFFEKIATDDTALKAFVDDPQGDPAAAQLTAEQRRALLSARFSEIDRLLREENRDVVALADSHGLGGASADGVQQIGWNMAPLMDQITALKTAKT